MALVYGPSSSSSNLSYSSARYPIRLASAVTVDTRVVDCVKPPVPPPLPTSTVRFDVSYRTIDLFFRDEMMLSLTRRDAPPLHLVLDAVTATALPDVRVYIEKFTNHAKIDYNPTSNTLIVSCASLEHNVMANIGVDIMGHVTGNSNAFTGGDPAFKIIENGDTPIPLGDKKYGRQPDGGLRLLNRKLRPPFLIWEVLDSKPLLQMIEKISHYFTQSHGRIRIAIVIQLLRQPPPQKPKRKRRPSSIGDETDVRRTLVEQREPELLPNPPPGRLVKGFYWVYRHGRNDEGKHVIKCAIKEQEFYPVAPAGALTLTWADILDTVPPSLADRSVNIPFTMLHERFAELIASAEMPDDAEDAEPADTDPWVLDSFPGITAQREKLSDPVSEGAASDVADGNFKGMVDQSAEEAVLRRSSRIARDVVE